MLLRGLWQGKAAAELELPQPVLCALLPCPLAARELAASTSASHWRLVPFLPDAGEDPQTPSFPMSIPAVRLNHVNANNPLATGVIVLFKHRINNLQCNKMLNVRNGSWLQWGLALKTTHILPTSTPHNIACWRSRLVNESGDVYYPPNDVVFTCSSFLLENMKRICFK